MKRAMHIMLLSGLAICLNSGGLQGQHAGRDAGPFWVGVGLGAGWASLGCDICRSDFRPGPAGYVELGTQPWPRVRLGLEGRGWTADREGALQLLGALNGVAYFFPYEHGLFLKTGLGFTRYRAGSDLAMGAPSIQLGAGYEVGLAQGIALEPFISVQAAGGGTLRNDDGEAVQSGVTVAVLQFGIGLIRH